MPAMCQREPGVATRAGRFGGCQRISLAVVEIGRADAKLDPKRIVEGHARLPEGLAEPTLTPQFPQKAAEVMVAEASTGPGSGRPLTRLDEVQVGPTTAKEIRWQPPNLPARVATPGSL